jgi:predicted O-linked N-acetylglucosamine transferase (SPINDLY family)
MPPARLQRLIQEGIVLHRAGRLDEAAALYRAVRAGAPRNFDALHLLGFIAYQQGRSAEAIALLKQALQLSPQSGVCEMRLGLALLAAGRPAEAEARMRQVVQRAPQDAETWTNLALCLKLQNRLAEAEECHQRAVTVRPDYASGWYNYGLTLAFLGRTADALRCHERALVADPQYALARYGRAQALMQMHRVAESVADYDRYLAAEPGNLEARSYRLFARHYLDGIPREQVFEEHQAYGRAVRGQSVTGSWGRREPSRRLRLGILSPDLRTHSCACFLEPLLRHLDRGQFDLLLFHDHFCEDGTSRRLRTLATVWRNFVGQLNPDVERVIRGDAPDILIDLAGHTGMNRLPLFARRLAPVQVTYLGYPDTTGLAAMDYRFTDAVADPEGEADRFATEKLVRFAPTAWTYQPLAEAPALRPPPSAAGTPITFGSFNNPAKISDATLGVWNRLLQTVPASRLLLKGQAAGDPVVQQFLRARFQQAGLPAGRVELLERTSEPAEHLALYDRVDVALDTTPYNGTTTTCEALWQGVPVVTQLGDRHASRVSASLLTAIGHREWIAESPDDYVRIAAGLANAPARLTEIRNGLREEMRCSALLDHAGQAARFGTALRACWVRWCASVDATPSGRLVAVSV